MRGRGESRWGEVREGVDGVKSWSLVSPLRHLKFFCSLLRVVFNTLGILLPLVGHLLGDRGGRGRVCVGVGWVGG